MIRRSRAPLFDQGGEFMDAETDPRTGLTNLSDIMLVLAVAIMVALLSHFGITATGSVEEDELESVTAEDSTLTTQDIASSSQYEEAGTVYRDTETGELYVLED